MKPSDFHYELPNELIALEPPAERTAARLLVVEQNAVRDRHIRDLLTLLSADDLVVVNNTEVLPARLFGRKSTGGKVEILLERIVGDKDSRQCLAQIRASKAPKVGQRITFDRGGEVEIVARLNNGFYQLASEESLVNILKSAGQVPLPPYIDRAPSKIDSERYQTVYASKPGAVAAPTAGLHFDLALIDKLKSRGIEFGFTTLHVGAATFQPLRVKVVQDHVMHSEFVSVDELLCTQVKATQARGGRVVAIGTTSARALESASQDGEIKPYHGDTQLFIYPSYEFKVVDALLTNFHLPESTLIMLVSAFIGRERTLAAYQHAITRRYRFFSYGDAMWLPGPLVD